MSDKETNFVKKVFTQVPATYELVNHVLTFGLDIVLRKRSARIAAKAGGDRWVDMCTGTGETAAYLSRLAPDGTKVYAVDFSPYMLEAARKKPEAENISFIMSDVKFLPFPDRSFDLITISFATRNINLSKDILTKSFAEMHRILKSGGSFINLETSQPSNSIIRKFMRLYIRLFVKFIGSRISRSKIAYAYLSKTIPLFYPPEELADIMRQAGFASVSFSRHIFGSMAIHQGVKK